MHWPSEPLQSNWCGFTAADTFSEAQSSPVAWTWFADVDHGCKLLQEFQQLRALGNAAATKYTWGWSYSRLRGSSLVTCVALHSKTPGSRCTESNAPKRFQPLVYHGTKRIERIEVLLRIVKYRGFRSTCLLKNNTKTATLLVSSRKEPPWVVRPSSTCLSLYRLPQQQSDRLRTHPPIWQTERTPSRQRQRTRPRLSHTQSCGMRR